jgi:phosphatidylglycerophosphatase A
MTPDRKFLLSQPAHFLALGLGAGLAPKAPGTWGSLAALPLFWLLTRLAPDLIAVIGALIAAFAVGVWACDLTGRQLGVPDHGSIVWDEIVAMWLILAFIPAEWLAWLAAFLLFRFFDILKPWPIRHVDTRLKNGFGVMLDDVLAAVYTLAIFKGLQWLA